MGIRLARDPVKAGERAAVQFLLPEHERAGVPRSLIRDGDLTGFGLVNAVSGYAQEVEQYDRPTELEPISGPVLEQDARQWSELAEPAEPASNGPRGRCSCREDLGAGRTRVDVLLSLAFGRIHGLVPARPSGQHHHPLGVQRAPRGLGCHPPRCLIDDRAAPRRARSAHRR